MIYYAFVHHNKINMVVGKTHSLDAVSSRLVAEEKKINPVKSSNGAKRSYILYRFMVIYSRTFIFIISSRNTLRVKFHLSILL